MEGRNHVIKRTLCTKNFILFLLVLSSLSNLWARHTSRYTYTKSEYQPISCHNRFTPLAELEQKNTLSPEILINGQPQLDASRDYLPLVGKNRFAEHAEDKILPIVLVHGLTQNGAGMADTKALLQKLVPGVEVFTPDLPDKALANCAFQVQYLATYINEEPALKDGFNLVCHSMGGIIGRGVIESGLLTRRAYSFITLATPHQGVCGIPSFLCNHDTQAQPNIDTEDYVDISADNTSVVKNWGEPNQKNKDFSFYQKLKADEEYYRIAYTETAQHHSSIANIWNEPNQHQMYCDKNLFLPAYNNEIQHKDSAAFRHNLTTVLAFASLSGQNDTVIKPLASELWDYWDATHTKIVPLEKSPIYDALGLSDLAAENKLKRFTVPGKDHSTIRTDEDVLRTYVLPSLIRESQKEEDTDANLYEETQPAPAWCYRFLSH